jgi:hypothetical protein
MSPMLTRTTLVRLLFLASFALLVTGAAAAVYFWLSPPAGESGPPELVVRDTERDIGKVPLRTYVQLDFPVSNNSDQPMRILGFAGG